MADTEDEFISADTEVDLTNCDREPIHIPGRIQPFGFLLALDGAERVVRCTQTAADHLGRPVDEILGMSARDLLGSPALHTLRGQLQMLEPGEGVERVFGLTPQGLDSAFDFAVHRSGGLSIIEGEPSADTGLDAAAAVSRMTARLSKTETIDELAAGAVRHMRALTGFDRVMVYRFAPDGSGEVMAEAARSDLEPYLGLHYPASDIPKQARELYKRNLLRIIADVDAAPVPILPDDKSEGRPIDLSHSVLRAVSPIHIEYLQNIGVGASMSVSILRGGQLWGLFACHHMSAHRVPFDVRTAAELFGQIFSYMLETRAQAEAARHETRARQIHARMMQSLAEGETATKNIADSLGEMMGLLDADGAACLLADEFFASGATPSREEIGPLIRFLSTIAAQKIYSTDELSADYDPAANWTPDIAGMMAVPLSRTGEDYLLFFRGEVAQTVNWAGDPSKPAVSGPQGARLSPRQSFELWKEVVEGKSKPWSEFDETIAESLRISLLEVILQLTGAAARARKEAQQRQELLIAELNHRVKNILALIRGLVAQSREAASDVNELADVIGARIQALARAHDQLTQSSWGPRPLRALIQSEAEAYFGEKADRVSLDGPDILVTPEAFSALALVIHELATNSAKYGALADSAGEVTVTWRFSEQGGLDLRWGESGGPPVKPPQRKGFGTTIVEKVVPHDLDGRADIEYALSGVKARFLIPAKHLAGMAEKDAQSDAQPGAQPAAVGKPKALGTDLERVLLVEDNLIIALDAEDLLKQLGAASVDTAGTVKEALRQIEANPPTLAVLDVNLGSETSIKIADRLMELGVPYIFATGYGEALDLSPAHADAPIVNKPYTSAAFQAALDALPDAGEAD